MDWLRKIVSGKRNRFKDDTYNLDITYVTKRVLGTIPATSKLFPREPALLKFCSVSAHSEKIGGGGSKYPYQCFLNWFIQA